MQIKKNMPKVPWVSHRGVKHQTPQFVVDAVKESFGTCSRAVPKSDRYKSSRKVYGFFFHSSNIARSIQVIQIEVNLIYFGLVNLSVVDTPWIRRDLKLNEFLGPVVGW